MLQQSKWIYNKYTNDLFNRERINQSHDLPRQPHSRCGRGGAGGEGGFAGGWPGIRTFKKGEKYIVIMVIHNNLQTLTEQSEQCSLCIDREL